jgi:hypothetical protein
MMNLVRRPLRQLGSDTGGVAFVEFAYSLPIFLALALSGLEITNYVSTRMRVSQVALHIADHAARMGEGDPLAARTISERQINDVLTGAGLQAGGLDLYTNGRVILSNLQPIANPNPTDRYRITWQRCRGSQAHASSYGTVASTATTPIAAMGPAGQQVKAPVDSATMFVEVYYRYTPIIASDLAPSLQMTEIASMVVRERRNLAVPIPNPESAPVSDCT